MPFLIFAILIGFLVYRKANSAAQEQKNGQPMNPPRPQAPRQTAPPTTARPAATAERTYQGVSRPGAEGYAAQRMTAERPSAERPAAPKPQPAQTQGKTAAVHTDVRPAVRTAGSLRFASEEGRGSVEGTASTEGECIEENPQHCAVEHFPDAVYDEDTGFAVDFDRRKLLSAMIMGEVLNAPKWKTN